MSQELSAAHIKAREDLLDAAIAAGKIHPAARYRYAAMYDVNPDAACHYIALAAPTLAGLTVKSGRADTVAHRRFLTDAERQRVAAAERGERPVITRIHD